MIGKWDNSCIIGIAVTSNVLRVLVSNVRIPRSHNTTCSLPSDMMYSAAINHSSYVADKPRFKRTGLFNLPTSFKSVKFCMLRAPI